MILNLFDHGIILPLIPELHTSAHPANHPQMFYPYVMQGLEIFLFFYAVISDSLIISASTWSGEPPHFFRRPITILFYLFLDYFEFSLLAIVEGMSQFRVSFGY